jgi:hypothetical protein
MTRRNLSFLTAFFLFCGNYAVAERLYEDKNHVRVWNRFAEQTLDLHKKLINQLSVTRKTRIGGYANLPEFYREDSYYHNEKLVSRVQWEREQPNNLHVIEVYVRADNGRVIRDYTAAYLPQYRNAPVQTLVSLHAYNDGLHAFRSFDASDELVVERCTGELDGKKVNILLDLDQILEASETDGGIMQSREYRRCFAGLPDQAGEHLTPH